MSLSVVLRINTTALREGRLAGEACVVGVDVWSMVHSGEELLALLQLAASAPPDGMASSGRRATDIAISSLE